MAKLRVDASKVPREPPSKRMPRRARQNGPKPTGAPPGSYSARVRERRVDLVDLIENGLPALEYLPASDGMLVRGKRHLLPAPHKTGKSIAVLVHAVDVTLAGAKVAILDRENGRDLYARRLADIFAARKLTKTQREQVRKRLAYIEFPILRATDAIELVQHFEKFALVVFDSQRMYLSDFDLKEGESDDYARFMAYAVDPLFREGVATLILDNTGHTEQTRGRGSSAKGDLNEVLFSMKVEADFDPYRQGRLRLKVERSRFGNTGEWTMDLGGGVYDPWKPLGPRALREDFLAAVLDVLSDRRPLGRDKLLKAVRARDLSIRNTIADEQLDQFVADPKTPLIRTPDGYRREGS